MTRQARSFSFVAAGLALMVILGACDFGSFSAGERGSGILVAETRQVDPFSQINVSSAIRLDVTVDAAAEPSVLVTYDDNMLDNLTTRVTDGRLFIELEGNINLTGDADRVVNVVMTGLTSVTASGATDVTISGATGDLDLAVSGASHVDLRDLAVGDVTVQVSGASSVSLNTEGTVSGSASGASNVTVDGQPESVVIETSGAASADLP